jgi:hypothetical protein
MNIKIQLFKKCLVNQKSTTLNYLKISTITLCLSLLLFSLFNYFLKYYAHEFLIVSMPFLQLFISELILFRNNKLTKSVKFKIRALNVLFFILITFKPLLSFEFIKPGWTSFENEFYAFDFQKIVFNPSIDDYLVLILFPVWLLLMYLINKTSDYLNIVNSKWNFPIYLITLWFIILFIIRNIVVNPIIGYTLRYNTNMYSNEISDYLYSDLVASFNPVNLVGYSLGNFWFCGLPSLIIILILFFVKRKTSVKSYIKT